MSSLSRFDRMVAIPEDEYNQLRSMQQVNNPETAHFLQLSRDYRKQDAIQDPYTRIHLQGETLDQMKQVKDTMRQRLLQATPKPYQNRADTLFNFIKDKVRISPKGELYRDDGQLIEGSNITDLVQHAVRDRRRAINPDGWKDFVRQLKVNNVPNMILNYDTLDELRSPQLLQSRKSSHSPSPKKSRLPVSRLSLPARLETAKHSGVRKSSRKKALPKHFEDFHMY